MHLVAQFVGIVLVTALFKSPVVFAQQAIIKHHGTVAAGTQFDVVVGPANRIHLISRHYYQFDSSGAVLIDEIQARDEEQSPLSFSPALSVDPAGNAHMLTRSGGSWGEGVDIYYQKRLADGTWLSDTNNYIVGDRETRNYVIGIATPTEFDTFAYTSRGGTNVWGPLRFWQLGDSDETALGDINDIWRLDADARFRSANETVYLATSKPNGGGYAYFSWAEPTGDIVDQLETNLKTHRAGSGRSGSPEIYPDKRGNIHLSYGSKYTVYYNQYDQQNQLVFDQDKLILENLNPWHLNFGLSTVAASDDGKTVMVAALKTDVSKIIEHAQIVLAYSIDGGDHWQNLEIADLNSAGGEGRLRPRMVAIGEMFYLFYYDPFQRGIKLVSIDMEGVSLATNKALPAVNLLLLE